MTPEYSVVFNATIVKAQVLYGIMVKVRVHWYKVLGYNSLTCLQCSVVAANYPLQSVY